MGLQRTFEIIGRVKWFDLKRGYGFIASHPDGADVLLHLNVLRPSGHRAVAPGAWVRCVAERKARGLQVVSVLGVGSVPIGAKHPAVLTEAIGQIFSSVQLVPARVKWFNPSQGYGFANSFGEERDVFLHKKVLRAGGFTSLEPGEGIAVRIVEGESSLVALEALPWNAALDDPNGVSFSSCDNGSADA